MTTVECDRCFAKGYADQGDLQPDDWSRRNGMNLCTRCTIDDDTTYLRVAGWQYVRAALDDAPDGGVWADPLGQVRHQPLAEAVKVQSKRDGYGQLELGAAS